MLCSNNAHADEHGSHALGSNGQGPARTIQDSAPMAEQPPEDLGADHNAVEIQACNHAEAGSSVELLEQLPLAARLAEKQQQQRRLAEAATTARPRSQSPAVVLPAQLAPAPGKILCLSTCHAVICFLKPQP